MESWQQKPLAANLSFRLPEANEVSQSAQAVHRLTRNRNRTGHRKGA
jgi:hypothetical protein